MNRLGRIKRDKWHRSFARFRVADVQIRRVFDHEHALVLRNLQQRAPSFHAKRKSGGIVSVWDGVIERYKISITPCLVDLSPKLIGIRAMGIHINAVDSGHLIESGTR